MRLCNELIRIAINLNYDSMYLDTILRLKAANHIYEKLGFKDIPAYCKNPDETARYMSLSLNKSAQQGDAPEPDSCRSCLSAATSRPGDL